MKKYFILLILCLPSYFASANEYIKFRVEAKYKKELIKNGDSFVTMIESYLDNNEKSLSTDKNPVLSDPTNYITALSSRINSNKKLYKNICVDCYISEYNNQMERLDNHGLSNKNLNNNIMESFFDQNEASIKKTYETILEKSEKKFTFDGISLTQGRYVFKYFDESTRGTNNPKYLYFQTNKSTKNNLYSFSLVEGVFSDFAGFWVEYINPDVSFETLSVKGDKYVYKLGYETRTIQLIRENNNWLLRNY